MRRRLILAALICLFAAPLTAAEPIKPADFAELHALIQPKEEESAWLSIAWDTDLWRARKKAAELGKPILLWEMDGHPLGCG